MTPINPDHYPTEWPQISKRIREDRAEGRCECDGRCGRTIPAHVGAELEPLGYRPESTWNDAPRRCTARQGEPSQIGGGPVVLTTAHLDHVPMNVDDTNLRAMCQACHLAYDAPHHAETRARNRGLESVPLTLIDEL